MFAAQVGSEGSLVVVEVVEEGAGSLQLPDQAGGGMGVGVKPPGIPTSGGMGLLIRPRKRRSHQSFPSLFLSPGGPVTFTGGAFEAVGTGTTLVQVPAVKVTLVAPEGGIGLLSTILVRRQFSKHSFSHPKLVRLLLVGILRWVWVHQLVYHRVLQ